MNFDQVDLVGRQIDFEAPGHVREAIASLGRTEDVRFSPSNRSLAVVDHFGDKIAIFEMSMDWRRHSKSISINGVVEISSPFLQRPHGIDFIDDNRIIVANREGQPCIFDIPHGAKGKVELSPSAVVSSEKISSPGSIAVRRTEQGEHEALICNNYTHKITRHLLDIGQNDNVKSDAVLLEKWIQIPDGICVSKDKKWVAISNHDTHAVFLYKYSRGLNVLSDPDGILCHYYPHGLRFALDDRFMMVASGGSPYINVYEASDSDWSGVRRPVLTLKVLSNEDFLRCRISREDGGPKGLDISNDMNFMVMTCENKALAFFDVSAILESASSNALKKQFSPDSSVEMTKMVELKYQLYRGKFIAASTAAIRWVLRELPMLSRLYNKGRRLWNPHLLTRPF